MVAAVSPVVLTKESLLAPGGGGEQSARVETSALLVSSST